MYRRLGSAPLLHTATLLRRRIEERFPESGLSRVALELEAVTGEAAALSSLIARPSYALRVAVGVGVLLFVAVLVGLVTHVKIAGGPSSWSDLVQGLEALVNDFVFVGIAIFALLSLEPRSKRRRVLTALHTLRSLAHIVDMHQLTKDPDRLLVDGPSTVSSPQRTMTPFELARYLDYSTEMLAIVAKIAALYVQEFADPIALDAAGSVQALAVDLSRAIGQKIMQLDRRAPGEPGPGAVTASGTRS